MKLYITMWICDADPERFAELRKQWCDVYVVC